MSKSQIITIRPMYTTDTYHKPFVKGIKVAILDGEIIARHFDNVASRLPEKYKSFERNSLSFDEIDWELAGYKKV